MSFPDHIERVLQEYGVRADTKAALFDLYVSLGDEVLDVFAGIAEDVPAASLAPEDTIGIRGRVVAQYLRRCHPQWLAGKPTPSLWHPRDTEGRASGAAIPLGELPEAAYRAVGSGQSVPEGRLILGRNAHYGGRAETISFDVVATDVEDAIALASSVGQQHTLPGSAGATSGTYDGERNLLLIWEVQPNVYKPSGDRNRAIAKIYRRHRNWHLATLAVALDWARGKDALTFILRGAALATTHEVNPGKPVSPAIATLHDRTVDQVLGAIGATLGEVSREDELILLDSIVMNHALRQHVLREGTAGMIGRVGFAKDPCPE